MYLGFAIFSKAIGYYYGTVASLIGIVGILAAIFVLKKFESLAWAARINILVAYISFLIFISTNGGLASPTIPWLITLPIAAYMFDSRRSGFLVAAAMVLTVAAFYILKSLNINLPMMMPLKSFDPDVLVSLTGAIAYIVFLVTMQDKISRKQSEQLELLLKENQEKQQELLQQSEEIAAQRDAIIESQKQLATILELLPDAVLIIDANGRVTHWNKALENLTGVPAKKMIGNGDYQYAVPFYGKPRPILIDLAKEPSDFLKKNYKNISIKNNVLKAESYVPALKGQERYLIGIATALYDEKNNYLGAIEVIHDITDLKLAEQTLKEQNEELLQQQEEIMAQRDAIEETQKRLATILELLPDAIFIVDANGIVTHWNKAMEELTGIPAEKMIGKGNLEYSLAFYPERRKILIDLVKEPSEFLFKNYRNIKIHDQILKAETFADIKGQKRYVIALAAALYDSNHNYTGAIEVIHDITNMKLIQIELQEKNQLMEQSEARLRKILDLLPNAVFITDKDGFITHWNKQMEILTGFRTGQMLGKGNHSYAVPFFGQPREMLIDYVKLPHDYIKKNLPDVKIRGNVLESERPVKLKKQSHYLISYATAIYNNNNQYDGAIQVIVDITERKKEQQRLKYLSLVAEYTDNAVVIMDNSANIQWINPAFEHMFGLSPQQLSKHSKLNIRQIWNDPNIEHVLNNIIQEKKSHTLKLKNTSTSGETIYTQTTISPVLDDNNEIINLIAISTDISEIIKYENELEQKNEEILQQTEEIMAQRDALAESEQKIRTILESLPDAALVINKQGKVVYWNKAIEKMTGIPASYMVGKGDFEYAMPFYGKRRPILVDLAKHPTEYLKKNYKNISVQNNFIKAESYVPNLRGQEHYLIGVAAPIYDAKGEYAGAIEIIHDITPIKKAKEQIELKQKEITNSINYAKYIQQTILPADKFMKNLLKDYFLLYLPKDIVSGDFYWIRKIAQNLIIAIADCTGHGVPGALVSMLGLSFLNDITRTSATLHANTILEKLRLKVKKAFKQKSELAKQKDGMDIALAIINTETLQLEFAGAYNPLYIFRKSNNSSDFFIIPADRQPIGIYINEKPFTNHSFQLHHNDTIYMFTDGFADQFGPNGKLSIKRFKTYLSQIFDKPLPQQKSLLLNYLKNWQQNYPQIDDILVLGFKI